jgi:hypothetical protein
MVQNMKPTSKDYLLKEYEQIASAFFDDRKKETDLLQYYIALITAPLSLIAAAISLGGKAILSLPPEVSNIIGVVIVVVALAGLLLMDMITGVRFEALGYARTVNLIRKSFKDEDPKLDDYFVLPTTDALPKFFELGGLFAGEVVLPALLDSMLLGFGVWFLRQNLNLSIVIAFAYFVFHIVSFAWRAHGRDLKWKVKAPPESDAKMREQASRLAD